MDAPEIRKARTQSRIPHGACGSAPNGSTAYAIVISPSLALFLVNLANALLCACVVIQTMWKRRHLTATGVA